MLTQRGEQGISTLLLTPPQAPQWMAVPTSPITTLTAPQIRLYWASPGDLAVPHYIKSWEQLWPMTPSPLEDTMGSSS